MKKRLVLITVCIVLFLIGAFQLKRSLESQETFSKAVVKYGSKGKDVYELQGRLKYLGFYKGDVDGRYAWKTLRAVKYFQWKFGIKANGIVESKTKLKLWKATKNWSPDKTPRKSSPIKRAARPVSMMASNRNGLSTNDIRILANAVYGESRGEPYVGQVAVAAVILNRSESPNFPHTPTGVIFQPGAFTAVADGQIWLQPNAKARKAVVDALNGWDPTGGCIYYFNPATATSKWIWSRPQVKRIGKHIFCR